MCSFIAASWLILNLTHANFFLQPRGPDATNRWSGYGYDFVHNLLHMTGERVLQPFHDEAAQVVAFFNGELYNWRALQEEDGRADGDAFRSDGDALLSGYLRHGRRFVQRLDGEFALAIFDFRQGEAIFATDPFGTKPLFVARSARSGGLVAVASYRSALTRLLLPTGGGGEGRAFLEEEVQAVEPDSALVLELPRPLPLNQGGTRGGAEEADATTSTSQGAPRILARFTVFEFDLRQHKNHTRDWRTAFFKAVEKRAHLSRVSPNQTSNERPSMCFSDGYDSGAIALVLGKLGVQPALYTVQAREDVRLLLGRVSFLGERLGVDAEWTLAQLSAPDFDAEREFLRARAERVQYRLRPGYANVDDKAAAGLSWIFRRAVRSGRRLFLSGTGADEIISDYGIGGQPLEFHSTLAGLFPEDLGDVFPWMNVFLGTQRDYLAKEESTAGAHGVETRYPFLDRSLVQEYLWLTSSMKNSLYKAPVHELLESESFPFAAGKKRGFSADKNLVGENSAESPKSVVDDGGARDKLWRAVAAATDPGAPDSTMVMSTSSRKEEGALEALPELSLETGRLLRLPLHKLQEILGCSGTSDASDFRCSDSDTHSSDPLITINNNDDNSNNSNPTTQGPRLHPDLPHLAGSSSGLHRPAQGDRLRIRKCKSLLLAARPRRRRRPLFRRARRSPQSWAEEMAGSLPSLLSPPMARFGELAPPLSQAAANGHKPRHRVVVMTSCMEEAYFWTYCAPLLSSLKEAFQMLPEATEEGRGETRNDGGYQGLLRILVATAGVSPEALELVGKGLPPGFAEFVAFDDNQEHLDEEHHDSTAENYRRVSYQRVKLSQYVKLWQQRVLDTGVDFVVCMDSDMLVAKPFWHVFEYLEQLRVDVAFSYYDGTRQVPWGSLEEVSLTKGGFVRLQGGMLVMRNSWQAIQWFALWAHITRTLVHDMEQEGADSERWRMLFKEFKGPSQAALAFLLTRGHVELMGDVSTCSKVRTIPLQSLHGGEEVVSVRMHGLPSQYLNDAESTEDGSLPPSVHIVHLKGNWWRMVLPQGHEHIEAPTRTYEWNRQAFQLWRRHYATFGWAVTFQDGPPETPDG
ncbi:unnamed protein product [Polarella glacialis]|uniref:Glutamine amidotransferase type-2 domain-containing protein n=1 Tax=Polarella glacialis TaxID=89957 RepID=A0A813KXH7_POLGL|nr:unnamed protein product [Polarella glacialis]